MSALLNYLFYTAVALVGWHLLTKRAKRVQRRALVAIVASLVVGWVTWRFTSDWLLGDFLQAYYPAGASLVGEGASLRELISQGVRGFVNLPIVAALFVPFALMDRQTAGVVFTAAGVVAALAAWWLAARLVGLDDRKRWLLLYVFAANGPLIYSVEFGNTSHFVLLALVGTMLLWRTRRFVAGLLLGLAALVKLPLLLIAAFLLVRRQWAMLSGLVAVIGVASAVSVVWFGWDLHVLWYQQSVQPFLGGSMPAYNVQTVPAFVARLQTGGAGLRLWEPVAIAPGGRIAVAAANLALLMIGVWPSLRRSIRAQRVPQQSVLELEFSSALAFSVIASSLAWSHYYAWMLLPIAFLLGSPVIVRDALSRRLAFAGTWLVSLPVFPLYLPDGVVKDLLTQTIGSYLLVGGVLLFMAIARTRALTEESTQDTSSATIL